MSSDSSILETQEADSEQLFNQVSRSKAWFVWSLITLFFTYQFIVRVLPKNMMSEIMVKFSVDASAFGHFTGLYYIGYALMHIPVGLMLDKYGPKKVLPLCAFMVAFGAFPLIYSSSWSLAIIGRIMVGMGSSAATLGCFKVISMLFKKEDFNKVLGMSVTIGFLGAMYGGEPVAKLIASFGFETVLHSLAVIGIAIGVLSYLFMPSISSDEDSKITLSDLKSVLLNYRIIFISLIGGLMVGPVEGFADAWGPAFLKTVYGLNNEDASTLPSLIFLGFACGAPLLSYIADKTRAYQSILVTCSTIMLISFVILLYTQFIPVGLLKIMFFIIGIASAYQIVVIYLASISVSQNMVGLATAWANMILMGFGYFFHPVIGGFLDFYWNGVVDEGVKIYDAIAFSHAIAIIPIGLAISLLFLLGLNLGMKRKNVSLTKTA